MLQLIKLEYRKAQLKTLFLFSLLALPILIYWCVYNESGHVDGYPSFQAAFADIQFFVHTTYAIITAVLTSKIVLEEYRNKTMDIMFLYPHPRRKIALSKLIFISLFSFVSSVIGSLVVISVLLIRHFYIPFISIGWTQMLLVEEGIRTIFFALATVGISFVAYYSGMLRKSSATTIIAPFLITAISSEFYYGGSLSIVILISIGCLILGLILATISIMKMDQTDVQ